MTSPRVPAAEELLIDRLVTTPAVARRQLRRDHEPMVIVLLLTARGLVTVETVDTLLRVHAHFVLVHD